MEHEVEEKGQNLADHPDIEYIIASSAGKDVGITLCKNDVLYDLNITFFTVINSFKKELGREVQNTQHKITNTVQY